MHDVITIGSAMIDVFAKSPAFHLQPTDKGVLLCEQYGAKIDIDELELQSGGAGTNTAVGFARQGFKTAAVVEIGKDIFGQMVWDDLQREHVDTDFVIAEKSERTAASILLIAPEGGRTALTYRGAAAMLEPRDLPWQALRETRWVHLSNISGQRETLLRLFTHLQTGSAGLSWNPGQHELELLAAHELRASSIPCDILFVNKEEWQVVQHVQSELQHSIPIVIVTDGKKGGQILVRGEEPFSYQIATAKTVQETGAGDAFAVGVVTGHLMHKNISEAVQWGCRNAASVVQHMGAKAGLLRKGRLE